MSEVKIAGRAVGRGFKPFIIAELSGNHNQSLDRALELVRIAAASGADAVKIQTFKPESITLEVDRPEFQISNKDSLWYGRSLVDVYRESYTPWEWHAPIFALCRELNIIAFSSPFDEAAVDFLETFDMPCYKIASFECIDHGLIKRAARTGKPLIISTGMASVIEVGEAVQAAREVGCREIVLLKCTSAYPADPANINLATIRHMGELFPGCVIGLSDHTMGIGVSVAGVALGAAVIEKHITVRRSDGGVDAAFSMEPAEFNLLVSEAEKAWKAVGKVHYGPIGVEEKAATRRRSLYVAEDIAAGQEFTHRNIRSVRPGSGLQPKYLDLVIGKKAKQDLVKGTPLSWEILL